MCDLGDGSNQRYLVVPEGNATALASFDENPVETIKKLRAENDALAVRLAEYEQVMREHAGMLLCEQHEGRWGEMNMCPMCRADEAEKQVFVLGEEKEQLKSDNDGMLAAGGYDYMAGQRHLLEQRLFQALRFAEVMDSSARDARKELAEYKEEVRTRSPKIVGLEAWIEAYLAEKAEKEKAEAERDAYKPYYSAVDEALVVCCIGTASGDAKADLNRLVHYEQIIALDPAVSSDAGGLVTKGVREGLDRAVEIVRQSADEIGSGACECLVKAICNAATPQGAGA